MEYCCHVWASAPSYYLKLLDKLKKHICRTTGPSLFSSLEPLVYGQNAASSSLFYRYYFIRCSSELAQVVLLRYSQGKSTCYSDSLHHFSVTIPRTFKDTFINSVFPCTVKLWNSLPIECFLLTYDLSGFQSRINRNLLTMFFLNRFPASFNLFVLLPLLLLVNPCIIVAIKPCMEWIVFQKMMNKFN